MATRFLHYGATKRGEKGIYVSFAENREDYYNNMIQFDMNMKTLEEKGLFKFLDYPAMTNAGMREATTELLNEVMKFGAKRVVVDSLTAILQVLGQRGIEIIHSHGFWEDGKEPRGYDYADW